MRYNEGVDKRYRCIHCIVTILVTFLEMVKVSVNFTSHVLCFYSNRIQITVEWTLLLLV